MHSLDERKGSGKRQGGNYFGWHLPGRVSNTGANASTHDNMSCGDLPLFLDSLEEQGFVQVGNPFDKGRYVSPAIPNTRAINAVVGFSTLCKYDDTVLKPCSLGLLRVKTPSQCSGIGGRWSGAYAAQSWRNSQGSSGERTATVVTIHSWIFDEFPCCSSGDHD